MSNAPAFERITALLFDLDGTLIEPSIDFGEMKQAVLAVVHAFGQEPPDGGEPPVLEIIAQVRAQLVAQEVSLGRRFEATAQQAIRAVELAAAARVRAYEGAAEMLLEIERLGLRVGIVTRNCREAVHAILARIPLRHQALLTRDDVAYVKPDPRHLLAALAALDADAEHAAMCGDHVMDIQAGRAIGALTVGVLRPGEGPEVFAACPPDLILSHVTDLLAHLQPVGGGSLSERHPLSERHRPQGGGA